MPYPTADLGPCLISALGDLQVISVERYPAGSYSTTTGLWTQGTATTLTLDAVVQPAGPRETEQLPENERTKEALQVFTLEALQTSRVPGQIESDIVLFAGKRWKVMKVEDWTLQAGYARAICVREGE